MRLTGPFGKQQTKDNLIHLKEGQIVGQWRDSTYGVSIFTSYCCVGTNR
jgi:hypothetical protein